MAEPESFLYLFVVWGCMKLFILSVVLVLGLMLGCSPLASEIPVQDDTEEVVVESAPTGAAVSEEAVPENTSAEAIVPEEEITAVEETVEEASTEIERVPESTYITLTGVGFGVPDVHIKVGETVAWKNEREGRQTKAMVLGTQWCSGIVRSKLFGPGEVYRATFDKKGTCTVVDGMYTTELMKVIVEE